VVVVSDRGWFAEPTHETPAYPWQPTLQTDGLCLSLTVWFETKDECEAWIRANVLDAEMLEETR
jgi:hypothetical protein